MSSIFRSSTIKSSIQQVSKAHNTTTTNLSSRRFLQTTSIKMNQNQNEYGQGKSHASGDSVVPEGAQKVLPKGVEENVPNTVHDTGSSGSKSHAVGDSKVPKVLQEAVPESVERALPNAIHDTGDK